MIKRKVYFSFFADSNEKEVKTEVSGSKGENPEPEEYSELLEWFKIIDAKEQREINKQL